MGEIPEEQAPELTSSGSDYPTDTHGKEVDDLPGHLVDTGKYDVETMNPEETGANE